MVATYDYRTIKIKQAAKFEWHILVGHVTKTEQLKFWDQKVEKI